MLRCVTRLICKECFLVSCHLLVQILLFLELALHGFVFVLHVGELTRSRITCLLKVRHGCPGFIQLTLKSDHLLLETLLAGFGHEKAFLGLPLSLLHIAQPLMHVHQLLPGSFTLMLGRLELCLQGSL